MGKIWLVVLLAFGGSAIASTKTCELVLALRGLEASPEFAPLSQNLVRVALDDLRESGKVAEILRLLRQASWTTEGPIPRAQWDIAKFRADFYVRNDRPRLRLRFPRLLTRTPIALAVGLHEHLHARVYAILPELSEHESELKGKLLRVLDTPEAFAVAEELAELHYQHERLALIAESAVYAALNDDERRDLRQRLATLPREWLARKDRNIFRTAVGFGPVPVDEYLRRQYALERYSRESCSRDFREDVEAYRILAQDERDAKQALDDAAGTP